MSAELTVEEVEAFRSLMIGWYAGTMNEPFLSSLCDAALAHLRSQAGSVSVPREPTEAMTTAGFSSYADSYLNGAETVTAIYKAMLAASPPAGEGDDR